MSESEEEEPFIEENRPRVSFWRRVWEKLSFLKNYETIKEVRIMDRRLGYIYYGCFALIVLYLVIFVFLINKAYLDQEKAQGSAYVRVLGQAVSGLDYAWDAAEQNPWGLETNTAFIPSKVIVTQRQVQGICPDPYLYCESDSDCQPIDIPNVVEGKSCQETTEGTKGCTAWRWCPPESSESTEYYLENASEQLVWGRYKVEFKRIKEEVKENYSTEGLLMYPDPNANTWEVSDLTQLAGFNFSDIVEKGAVVQVLWVIKCTVTLSEDCEDYLEVKRVDDIGGGGYAVYHSYYYREGDLLYRDLYHMKGVKFLFKVTGIYITPSLYKAVLQFASALGLLIAATAITDGVMLSLLKEKSHFRKLKIQETEDLND